MLQKISLAENTIILERIHSETEMYLLLFISHS